MNLLETYASLLPDWRTVFSQERAFVLALARARPPAHLRLADLPAPAADFQSHLRHRAPVGRWGRR